MAENKSLPQGITLRKDGRYQARYTFQGKRHTIYGHDVKEVQKKLRDVKYEMDHGIFAKPDKIKVDDWYKTWSEVYQKNKIRKTTFQTQNGLYNYHVKGTIGNLLIQSVRVEHIQKLINDLNKEGYAHSYIARIRNFLNSMFNQAYKSEIILRNPVSHTTLPQEKEFKERRVLTRYEQEVFFKCVEGNQFETLFYLGFSTGMRISEILGLQWDDVNFADNEIKIIGSLSKVSGEEYEKTLPKTKNSNRTVPILPEIMKRLKSHKIEQMEYRLKCRGILQPVKGLEDLVFISPAGRPLARTTIFGNLKRIVDDMNHYERMMARKENREPIVFEYFATHTMRHTFATRALESGMPPKVVQEILGHSSIKITLDLYTHVLPETKTEEIKKIANLF